MNDIASIKNIRFLLSGKTFKFLDARVRVSGLGSGVESTFFADVFRGDNLLSLAVGRDVEGRLIETQGQIGIDQFGLWLAICIVEDEIELAWDIEAGRQSPINLLLVRILC